MNIATFKCNTLVFVHEFVCFQLLKKRHLAMHYIIEQDENTISIQADILLLNMLVQDVATSFAGSIRYLSLLAPGLT